MKNVHSNIVLNAITRTMLIGLIMTIVLGLVFNYMDTHFDTSVFVETLITAAFGGLLVLMGKYSVGAMQKDYNENLEEEIDEAKLDTFKEYMVQELEAIKGMVVSQSETINALRMQEEAATSSNYSHYINSNEEVNRFLNQCGLNINEKVYLEDTEGHIVGYAKFDEQHREDAEKIAEAKTAFDFLILIEFPQTGSYMTVERVKSLIEAAKVPVAK